MHSLSVISLFLSHRAFAFVVPHHAATFKKAVFMSSEVEVDPFEGYIPGETSVVAKKDTVNGDGEICKQGDILTVKYVGSLLATGKVFDKGTMDFKLGEGKVIPGWEQGLEGLRVGGKRTLKIPPNLAYGTRGAGDIIPANADLSFDCELEKVANGPLAEIMTKVSFSPRQGILLALLALSFLVPKGATVGDLLNIFGGGS
eukprot:CAMPEP_0194349372 /NCGR_PEP_ID=MMETSP0171-20130528/107051_1 /TAXON_ID=218684 /ORGANISM="Corethron pennatum, Strain L29A3" /LENGTH=200 /DNA_ID=CAMNT_0039116817 /DNA_START=519 /DNA_END=1121 /DNA_ORIENTATION=+